MVESLIVKFDQAKYKEFHSSGSKSPRARQYRKISSEICSQVPSKASPNAVCTENIVVGCITRMAPSTSPTRPARSALLTVGPLTPILFLSFRLLGVPNNSYGVTRTLNVDRDVRVNCRHKKLEQLSIQQIQNARLKLTSLLSYVRCAKSAFGDLNAKLKRLAFLKLHFPNRDIQ